MCVCGRVESCAYTCFGGRGGGALSCGITKGLYIDVTGSIKHIAVSV